MDVNIECRYLGLAEGVESAGMLADVLISWRE
jgi:hypothetical protein